MTAITVCVRCWIEGLTTPATCLVGSNTLCTFHAHPSQVPLPPRLRLVDDYPITETDCQ